MTPQQITVLILGVLAILLIIVMYASMAAKDREEARRINFLRNEVRALEGLPPLPDRF